MKRLPKTPTSWMTLVLIGLMAAALAAAAARGRDADGAAGCCEALRDRLAQNAAGVPFVSEFDADAQGEEDPAS